VGVLEGIYLDGDQVAIARVVTDGAIFAYLCDVYVTGHIAVEGSVAGWCAACAITTPPEA
jgi:cyanophycinase-like exopeptidase